MPYYQGDFYRIPGQRGDFLGSLGSIFGKVAGFLPGVGKVVSGLFGSGAKTGAAESALPLLRSAPASLMKMPGQAVSTVGKVIKGHPVLSAAGAAGAVGMAAGAGAHALARHIMNGGKKHRRMRVTNPKALRRSLRRVQGFSHIAMKVLRITHPHRRGKVSFRFKRRRKTV